MANNVLPIVRVVVGQIMRHSAVTAQHYNRGFVSGALCARSQTVAGYVYAMRVLAFGGDVRQQLFIRPAPDGMADRVQPRFVSGSRPWLGVPTPKPDTHTQHTHKHRTSTDRMHLIKRSKIDFGSEINGNILFAIDALCERKTHVNTQAHTTELVIWLDCMPRCRCRWGMMRWHALCTVAIKNRDVCSTTLQRWRSCVRRVIDIINIIAVCPFNGKHTVRYRTFANRVSSLSCSTVDGGKLHQAREITTGRTTR